MAKVNVRDKDGPAISSSTGSGEARYGISGSPECAKRLALFWREASKSGGTEEEDIEDLRMVGSIARTEELSPVATATTGSGEVAESRKFSVTVRLERDDGAGTNKLASSGTSSAFSST